MFKHINQINEQSFIIDFGSKIDLKINEHVNLFSEKILKNSKIIKELCIYNCVPSYNKILIQFDPIISDKNKIISYINSIKISQNIKIKTKKIIEIPICYDDSYSLDLEEISKTIKLCKEDIISLHLSTIFHVYMIGFLPGLPFMGNMNSILSLPRKISPRIQVPKGSVGIVDKLCVIYPKQSPGGWNIIGRTPINFFLKDKKEPLFLKPGNKVRFKKISINQFNNYGK